MKVLDGFHKSFWISRKQPQQKHQSLQAQGTHSQLTENKDIKFCFANSLLFNIEFLIYFIGRPCDSDECGTLGQIFDPSSAYIGAC